MAARRNQRSGVEDRWFRAVTVTDPSTGAKSTRREKSSLHGGARRRWLARYVDSAGKEHTKSFDRKVDGQKWLDTITTEMTIGTWIDPARSSVDFAAVAEQWFTTKSTRKPKTVAGYRSLLDTVVLPKWGETALRDIDFEDVQTWVTSLSTTGSYRFADRGLSASRVVQAYQVLDQVMRYAIKAKRIAVNPCDDLELPRRAGADKRFLTHREVRELALACGRFRVLVLVLAYTGIRFGEAIALRVQDVNLDRRQITVRRSATKVTGRGVVEGSTKNHGVRSVPLPAFLAEDLREQLGGRAPEVPVFPGREGGYLSIGELRWVFDKAAASIGKTGFVPHELRHTAASLAISAGANVKVVQRMLGHKSATMTLDLYGHLFSDDLESVADGLNQAANAAKNVPAEPLRNQSSKQGRRNLRIVR